MQPESDNKKTVIVYFSGTGNTRWAAEKLYDFLNEQGASIAIYSLEEELFGQRQRVAAMLQDAAILVIGYPVYGGGMPRNVKEFIDNLPAIPTLQRVALFCTQAGMAGDADIYYKKILNRKNYQVNQSVRITLSTNFHVALPPFSLMKPVAGMQLEARKREALRQIEQFSSAIINNRRLSENSFLIQRCSGILQRLLFRFFKPILPMHFKFRKKRCVKCLKCVKNCPVQNLYFSDRGKLKSRGRCIFCFRCYNFCPTNAINFGIIVRNPDRYIRYHGPESESADNSN